MIPLDNSLGALFISMVVGAALWGVGTAQVWHYLLSRPNDGRLIKSMVLSAWLFDTATQIIVTHDAYEYAITDFGNYFFLLEVPGRHWTGGTQIIFVMLTTLIVQGFYISRIWRLTGKKAERLRWLFVVPLLLLLVAETVVGSFLAAYDYQSETWFDLLRRSGNVPRAEFALAFVTDTLIAIMMCWLLFNSRTEYTRTNSLLSRLIVLTLSTNIITSLCAFGAIIVATICPATILFAPFFQNLIRLEVNSFLAALNIRPYLSSRARDPPPRSFGLLNFAKKLRARKSGAVEAPEWPIQLDAVAVGMSSRGEQDMAKPQDAA